jgi:hypothetical protein
MTTDASEVRAAYINRAMMEAARISEPSVVIDLTTRQYIPEDSELHTRRRENLKSHIRLIVLQPLLPYPFQFIIHISSFNSMLT